MLLPVVLLVALAPGRWATGDAASLEEPTSLLQVERTNRSEASLATADPSQVTADSSFRIRGHFLTDTELSPITAITCLEAKQRNPMIECESTEVTGRGFMHNYFGTGNFHIGNYPHYKSPECKGNGEPFCDPFNTLTPLQRANLTTALGQLRSRVNVLCGRTLNDAVDRRHYQPFYLGIAIVMNFPLLETDPESLQQFGRIVAAQWNMDRDYVGESTPYHHCPNTGILVIIPDKEQAFLSTSSCEFICKDRGGPEVAIATIRALVKEDGGIYPAVWAGMREVYRVLDVGPHQELSAGGDVVKGGVRGAQTLGEMRVQHQVAVSNLMMRGIFVVALIFMIASLVIAALVFLLAPGVISAGKRAGRGRTALA